jgi:hypothetical protein
MFLLSALCKGLTSIGLHLLEHLMKVILSQSKVQLHIINSAVNLSSSMSCIINLF